ncbi:hypothetical protein CSW77_26195, partial [Shigella flexneri]|uniref:ATP-binding protein n=1 Tax=Shigella flexneri TaxID=623 RepID=UPI000C0F3225
VDRIRDALVDACSNKLVPAIRSTIEVLDFEGGEIIRLVVDPFDPAEMPCYVKSQGVYGGSYLRSGDGDVRLNHYEVSQLLSNTEQPQFDRETVPGARIDDLDVDLVDRIRDALVDACSNKLVPAIRSTIEVLDFEGGE